MNTNLRTGHSFCVSLH